MNKISKAQIALELEFLKGIEVEGFDPYEALYCWARQECNGLERDQTIFLGNYTLIDTTPFVELKPVKLTIPSRDEPYISTPEDEEQYRCSDSNKVTQTGFAHWLFKRFDFTFEIVSTPN